MSQKFSSFRLVNLDNYNSYLEATKKISDLEKQLSESKKYKDYNESATIAELKAKIVQLEKELALSKAKKTIKEELANSTIASSRSEDLEKKTDLSSTENQSGTGTATAGIKGPDCSEPSDLEAAREYQLLKNQYIAKFDSIFKNRFIKNEKEHTDLQVGGSSSDLTPQLPLNSQLSDETLTDQPNIDISNNTGLSNQNSLPQAPLPSLGDLDVNKLLDSVRTRQRPKAEKLLLELGKHSESLYFLPSGQINIDGLPVVGSNIYELFPLLFKPVKNSLDNEPLTELLNALASLGLSHLILRHHTVALSPQRKIYLNANDRKAQLAEIKKIPYWYYLGESSNSN